MDRRRWHALCAVMFDASSNRQGTARSQLDVTVVLDRDGVAAARFEANAIPQTIVIGPDGTIARVFVGASKKLADKLRAAITEVNGNVVIQVSASPHHRN